MALPCERDKAILAGMRRGRRTAAIAAGMGLFTVLLAVVASRDALVRQFESLFRDPDSDTASAKWDGTVLSTLASSGKGWIDLGRVDRVRKGQVFSVFQSIKSGRWRLKGRLAVIAVEETKSEIRILHELDSLNPISTGDYVGRWPPSTTVRR